MKFELFIYCVEETGFFHVVYFIEYGCELDLFDAKGFIKTEKMMTILLVRCDLI